MKKFVKVVAACALALSFAAVSAMAAKPVEAVNNGNGMPSGAHFQIELIGHPGNEDVLKNDNSNGRAIMVPLSSAGKKTNELVCEGETLLTDDTEATWTYNVPKGAKIHFIGSEDGYAVLDRDATDIDGAKIQLKTELDPVTGEQTRAFDVYVRILGKPNTCMNIGAYALDDANQVWFWAGSIDLHRKAGKTVAENVNALFEVNWCEPDKTAEGTCVPQTTDVKSVFDSIFSDYLWNIDNTGARNVQVRFYPRAD